MDDDHRRVSRRTFLERLAFLGGVPVLDRAMSLLRSDSADAAPRKDDPPDGGAENAAPRAPAGTDRMAPARPLGKTGHRVCLFSLGGQATVEEDGRRDDAVAIVHRALDLGVNYVDTAPAYGPSQDHIGEVMATRRSETFLASKTHDRSRDGSLRLLDDSLRRLHTDHLDLWQLHNLTDTSDLDAIFSAGGAIHALEAARADGRVRFVGLTGHYDPDVLVEGIRRYPFDNVLCALNPADRFRKSFIETLLPVAAAKGMGIVGMKVPARGRMFRKGGIETMREAMGYVLSLPVSTVIIGCSTVAEVEENAAVARSWTQMPTAEMARLEGLARPYHRDATFFKGWT
jgi:aryl-alcohol dehydrogenase-like predicted oxidoreductase